MRTIFTSRRTATCASIALPTIGTLRAKPAFMQAVLCAYLIECNESPGVSQATAAPGAIENHLAPSDKPARSSDRGRYRLADLPVMTRRVNRLSERRRGRKTCTSQPAERRIARKRMDADWAQASHGPRRDSVSLFVASSSLTHPRIFFSGPARISVEMPVIVASSGGAVERRVNAAVLFRPRIVKTTFHRNGRRSG